MTLLSVSHHVNLANAYSRLNEKNGVEPAFFFGGSLCNFAIGGQYREPSGTLNVSATSSGPARRTHRLFSLRWNDGSKSGAAVVLRLCHGNHRYGVGSTVVRVWASKNLLV